MTEKRTLTFGMNIDPNAALFESSIRLAKLADEAGYDVIGIQDHPNNPGFFDTWTLITALAIHTKRVMLASNVMDTALRPPNMLIKAAESLQIMSEGRVILGVGAGAMGAAASNYGGIRLESVGENINAFEEALIILKGFQQPTAAPIAFDGKHHYVGGAQPGPIPQQPVPIWVGANKSRVLKLTGTYADGWFSPGNVYAPPETIQERQRIIDEAAHAANRDPRAIRRIYNLFGFITPSGAGRDDAGKPLIGSISFWIERLSYYISELGFDGFFLWPLQQTEAQAEIFATQVMPVLRQRFNG